MRSFLRLVLAVSPAVVLAQTRGPEPAEYVDLDICAYGAYDRSSPRSLSDFVGERKGQAFFRSVRPVPSKYSTQGCDLMVAINCSGTWKWNPIFMDVYSAYSGARIFQGQEKGCHQAEKLGLMLLNALRPGSDLNVQVFAERGQAAARSAAAPAVVAVPAAPAPGSPAPAAVSSEVDRADYKKEEDPNAFAVVVGIESYSHKLPPAQFAERDAQAVRSHLLALGVAPRHMKFLIGSEASKSNLEAYLEEWLARNVKPESRVYFYFSGHGAPEPGSQRAYLLPWDGHPSFLKKTGYPLEKLYKTLGSLPAREVIVAMDSCFSGAGGRSVLAEGTRPLVTKIDLGSGLGGERIVAFTAAAGDEVSGVIPEKGHGAFTYYFLKGLSGSAMTPSGRVTVKSLYDYLKPKVQDAAGLQNREQTPALLPESLDARGALPLR